MATFEHDMCIDSACKPDDMHKPVGLWPCHGQGGNQVTPTTDKRLSNNEVEVYRRYLSLFCIYILFHFACAIHQHERDDLLTLNFKSNHKIIVNNWLLYMCFIFTRLNYFLSSNIFTELMNAECLKLFFCCT